MLTVRWNWIAVGAATLAGSSAALAQVDPASGIDFVAVGAVGNSPWTGNGTPGDRAIGRGTVNYEYRIGKYEVKSNEWAEFYTAAFDRAAGDAIPFVQLPAFTGMFDVTPQNTQNPNARAFGTSPATEWRGTGGIDWRTAAIYCNWLHNGKATNREAFLSGAYDVSTFGPASPFGFSDQRERSPGAKYFIPSWDEWLKASHYDANKQNSDGTVGGWWLYSNGTNIPLTYGAPPSFGGSGTGMANAGFDLPGNTDFLIPLNSYPNVRTPWGLVDAAGMTSEWTEEVRGVAGSLEVRALDGSAWTESGGVSFFADQIVSSAADAPDIGSLFNGFRVAAAIPSPSTFAVGCGVALIVLRRRRLGGSEGSPRSISKRRHAIAASALVAASLAPSALAQVDPASGIDFVTVGAVGNAPWAGNGTPGDRAIGRGTVNYEYRIGKYEVKSNEWAEFFTAAFDRPVGDAIPHVILPFTSGMIATTPQNSQNPNARAFTTTETSQWRGVGGITWRTAAIYCNWLHNGKATNREAFLSGAYDVSTFGFAQPFGFSDQRERSPGAQYFIPSWDEWLKASHYDPNKQNGDGTTGGWWLYSNGTDIPLTYGLPPSQGGAGMANSGFSAGAFGIPLNSYPDVRTPWGLVDAAGMTSEWNEEVLGALNSLEARSRDGSAWTSSPGNAFFADQVISDGGDAPDIGSLISGFRIAAVVPAPSTFAVLLGAVSIWSRRRRIGGSDATPHSSPSRPSQLSQRR